MVRLGWGQISGYARTCHLQTMSVGWFCVQVPLAVWGFLTYLVGHVHNDGVFSVGVCVGLLVGFWMIFFFVCCFVTAKD